MTKDSGSVKKGTAYAIANNGNKAMKEKQHFFKMNVDYTNKWVGNPKALVRY